MNKYLIGCDPELFVRMKDGTYMSGHDLIPGTKHMPYLVSRGAIQVDGVALEFNTFPAETADEFIETIDIVIGQMESIARENARFEFDVVNTPTATFDEKYFNALPAVTRALGCTPDYNAYTGKENEPPATSEPFRTGSGHLHIGWTEGQDPHDREHFFECIDRVKQLDACLYLVSLLWDSDNKRRSLYGKIGAFRPKHFGVEYRPMSNAWVRNHEIERWIFNATVHAMELYDQGEKMWQHDTFAHYIGKVHEGWVITDDDLRWDVLDRLTFDYGFDSFPRVKDVGKEAA